MSSPNLEPADIEAVLDVLPTSTLSIGPMIEGFESAVAPAASAQAVGASSLQARDIPSRPCLTPIHLQSYHRERFGYARGDYPRTEMLGDTCLDLPFSSIMTREQVEHVCAAIGELVEAGKRQAEPGLSGL